MHPNSKVTVVAKSSKKKHFELLFFVRAHYFINRQHARANKIVPYKKYLKSNRKGSRSQYIYIFFSLSAQKHRIQFYSIPFGLGKKWYQDVNPLVTVCRPISIKRITLFLSLSKSTYYGTQIHISFAFSYKNVPTLCANVSFFFSFYSASYVFLHIILLN